MWSHSSRSGPRSIHHSCPHITQWGQATLTAGTHTTQPPSAPTFPLFSEIDLSLFFLPFFFHFVCTGPSLQPAGSVVEAHGFSCPVACEILVPQPGIEPTLPALESEASGPPGESLCFLSLICLIFPLSSPRLFFTLTV